MTSRIYRSLLVGFTLILLVRAQLDTLVNSASQAKSTGDAGVSQVQNAGQNGINDASKLIPQQPQPPPQPQVPQQPQLPAQPQSPVQPQSLIQPQLPPNANPNELAELAKNLIKPGVETKPNQPFELNCPDGEVIDTITPRKVVVDGHTDTLYTFTTKKISTQTVTTSQKRIPIGLQGCFRGEFLCGLLSKWEDGKRRFASQCCKSDHIQLPPSANTIEKRTKLSDVASTIKSDSADSSLSNIIITDTEVISFFNQFQFSEAKVVETTSDKTVDETYTKEVKVQREVQSSASGSTNSSSTSSKTSSITSSSSQSSSDSTSSKSSSDSSSSSSTTSSESKTSGNGGKSGEKCGNGKGKGKGHCKGKKNGRSKEGSGEKHKGKHSSKETKKSSSSATSESAKTSDSSKSSFTSESSKTVKVSSSSSTSSDSSSSSSTSDSKKVSETSDTSKTVETKSSKTTGTTDTSKGSTSNVLLKSSSNSSTSATSGSQQKSNKIGENHSEKSKEHRGKHKSQHKSSESRTNSTSKLVNSTISQRNESKSKFTAEEIQELTRNTIKSGEETKPNRPFAYECAEDEVIESVTTRKVVENGENDVIFIFTSKKIDKTHKLKGSRRILNGSKGVAKHGCHMNEYVCGVLSKKIDKKRRYAVECCKNANLRHAKSTRMVKKTTKLSEKGGIAQAESSDLSLVNLMITPTDLVTFYQKYEFATVQTAEDDKSFEKTELKPSPTQSPPSK